MIKVLIPSRQNAPPAVNYMLKLGHKRLTMAEYVQLLRENKHCAGPEPYKRCAFCPYAQQCAALFDGFVDRLLWYSKGGTDDTDFS